MKIQWAVPFRFIGGNAAGYTGSSINLRKALQEIGVEITDSAKTVIHYCHPADCFPVNGKINLLWTMYESDPVPPIFAARFKQVDAILTPTNFCKDLFEPFRGKKPLLVSKLGFDESMFTFKQREWDQSKPFQWLWLGSPNGRHGWGQVVRTWQNMFADKNFCHLFMKTSSETGEGKLEHVGNTTFDNRMYSFEEIRDLYHSAHGFLHPIQGAGFSLPIAESMATGLPTIATSYGGQSDFFDSQVGWIVRHDFKMIPMTDGSLLKAACADTVDLGRKMLDAMEDYPAALARARRGADRMHNKWTWHNAAWQFVKNLQRLGYDS